MPTEIFCSRCLTVAFRSDKDLGRGDLVMADDLEVVDVRQPQPKYGDRVVCGECGDSYGFMARGDGLGDDPASLWKAA